MESDLELGPESGAGGLSASFIVIAVILSTIVVCTFVGNLFVIVAILVDKNLQTTANQLVLSLAVADLMVACLVMPLGAYNDIHQGWWLGTGVCEFWTSADVLCCTASILNLLAIALDRYWAVTNVDYIYKRTRQRVSLMILCAWTVGAVVSLAPIFGWKDPDFARRVLDEHKCLVSQDVAYQIFATISTFYSPLVLLLALYWRIFQVARKRIRCKPGGKTTVQSLAPPSTKRLASSITTPGVMASVSGSLATRAPPNGTLEAAGARADSSNEITSGALANDLIKHPAGIRASACDTQTGVNERGATAAAAAATSPRKCSFGTSDRNDHRNNKALESTSSTTTTTSDRGLIKRPQTTSSTMTNEAEREAGQAAPGRPPQRAHSNNVAPERLLDVVRSSAMLTSGANSALQTDVELKMADKSNESAPSGDGRQNDEQTTTTTTTSASANEAASAAASRQQLPLLAHLHRQTSMDYGRLHPAKARLARALPLAGGSSVSPPEVAPLAECAASSMQSLSECQCCCCYLHTTTTTATTSDDEDDERSKTLGSTLSCGSVGKWPQAAAVAPRAHLNADDDKLPLPQNILALAAATGGCAASLDRHRHHRHSSAYSSSAGSASSSSTTKSMLAAAAVAELDDSLGFLEQRIQQQQLAQISLAKLVTQSSLTSSTFANAGAAAAATNDNNKSNENKLTSNEQSQSIDKQTAETGNWNSRESPARLCNNLEENKQKIKEQVNETVRHLSITVTSPSNDQSLCTAAPPPPPTLSVSIKRRFKVLGQMVSFVQTSRQFNSSSSAPTSQSGDEDEDDDESSPEERSARSLDDNEQEQQQVGAKQKDKMGAAASRTPARAQNKQEEEEEEANMRSERLHKHTETKLSSLLDRQATTTLASRMTSFSDQQSQLKGGGAHALPVSTLSSGSSRQQTRRQNLEMKREKKAAKTLAIITGVFVCCWLPFFVNAILMPICGLACTPSDLILSVLLWLGYLNSLLNPIIYTIFSPDFRRAFRRLLCWPSNSNSRTRSGAGARRRSHRVAKLA